MVRAVVTFYVDYVAVSQGPTLTPITQAFYMYADLTVRHQSASVMGSPLLARRAVSEVAEHFLGEDFPAIHAPASITTHQTRGDLRCRPAGKPLWNSLDGLRSAAPGDVRRSTAWPVGRLSAATGERAAKQSVNSSLGRSAGLISDAPVPGCTAPARRNPSSFPARLDLRRRDLIFDARCAV